MVSVLSETPVEIGRTKPVQRCRVQTVRAHTSAKTYPLIVPGRPTDRTGTILTQQVMHRGWNAEAGDQQVAGCSLYQNTAVDVLLKR